MSHLEQFVFVCDHGYSSSLAAAAFVGLRFAWGGDVVGGLEARRVARLPVAPTRPRRPGTLRSVALPDQ